MDLFFEDRVHESPKVVSAPPVIDFQAALNPEQYRAVTSPIGQPSLVLAGAGSGKTRTLTYRVAWLLEEGIAPWEILLLTFTNKAAKEMLERVERLTGRPAHEFWGGTFHHVCQRILRMHGEMGLGIPKNFNILDASDAEAFLSEAIREADPAFLKNKNNPKAALLGEIISLARNTCQSIQSLMAAQYTYLEDLATQVQQFYEAYKKRKKAAHVLDYDDLLEYAIELLEADATLLEKYQTRFRAILVDEYQDTNTLQGRFVDLMAAKHQVMAVGDDAQCIYSWRGADFENILGFPKRHPGTQIYKIEINYRSTPEILALANSIWEGHATREDYQKALKPFRPSMKKPVFITHMDTRQQAQYIVEEIYNLTQRSGYSLSDIAVLYRAHYHSMDLQMELSRRNLPYVITSGVRFFEQAHIKDIAALVRFANNPKDHLAFLRFTCLLPKVGPRGAEKLYRMACKEAEKTNVSLFKILVKDSLTSGVPDVAKEDWAALVHSLEELAGLLAAKEKPKEVFAAARTAWYGDFIRNVYPNWTARQEDLESLESFANRFESIEELLAQLVLLSSEVTDRSVGLGDNNIHLTTIHQAKGLEFPVVFIVGLAENLFPAKRSLDSGELEEERRLFYVAVTRAEDKLYLNHPRMVSKGPPVLLEPSCFVQELPEDTYEAFSNVRQRPASPNNYRKYRF